MFIKKLCLFVEKNVTEESCSIYIVDIEGNLNAWVVFFGRKKVAEENGSVRDFEV
jgi:hypothetical protein